MKRLIANALLSTVLAALLASHAATAATPVADDAVFVEGTRYSAVLNPSQGTWRLMPAAGSDIRLRLSPDCGAGNDLPRGLWLLTRNSAGQAELLAPSATALPAGHPGHVRLVGCDRAGSSDDPVLPVPPGLVEWLEHRSGAIYVVQ